MFEIQDENEETVEEIFAEHFGTENILLNIHLMKRALILYFSCGCILIAHIKL